jgi:hypothetical protein
MDRLQMKSSRASSHNQTRFGFRILAGIVGIFLLLIGFPMALSAAVNGTWEGWLFAACSLYAGVGLALGARTGRWYGS